MSYILLKSYRALTGGLCLLSLFCCQPARHSSRRPQTVAEAGRLFEQGEFTRASLLIDSLRQTGGISDAESSGLDSISDWMGRIRRDFSRDEQSVREQLSPYYHPLDDSVVLAWERSGKLEMRLIDGQKRYFSNAVPNLFRLDSAAARRKQELDGYAVDSLSVFRLRHLAEVIKLTQEQDSGSLFQPVYPVRMILTYTVRLHADAVPGGELVSCWMPFPREGNPRQKKVKLLSAIPDSFRVAPADYPQRTVFLQKRAVKGEPTVFQIRFSVETAAQYFALEPEMIQPYKTGRGSYRIFTEERPPHLVFTPEIRKLARLIVGEETNPLLKAEKIYRWINDSIPWASALEYGIIPQIQAYVLKNGHGDCGMQTLLFMSLARAEGIPAKWQSGWMLHPGHVNLHDWCEVFYEGIGWVPVDQSFKLQDSHDKQIREFYMHGIDAYRLIVNDDYARELYPPKKYRRSEPYDFQRGELEWNGGNLYFDKWSWDMKVVYHPDT
jgi:hypothetical protein